MTKGSDAVPEVSEMTLALNSLGPGTQPRSGGVPSVFWRSRHRAMVIFREEGLTQSSHGQLRRLAGASGACSSTHEPTQSPS